MGSAGLFSTDFICTKCGCKNTVFNKIAETNTMEELLHKCWSCGTDMIIDRSVLSNGQFKQNTTHRRPMGKKESGVKFDSGKLQWHLLPIKPIEDVIRVLMYGANKYSANNWKYLDGWRERYYDATMRHLTTWYEGSEECDVETDLSHLAHAISNLVFLYENSRNKD